MALTLHRVLEGLAGWGLHQHRCAALLLPAGDLAVACHQEAAQAVVAVAARLMEQGAPAVLRMVTVMPAAVVADGGAPVALLPAPPALAEVEEAGYLLEEILQVTPPQAAEAVALPPGVPPVLPLREGQVVVGSFQAGAVHRISERRQFTALRMGGEVAHCLT